MKLEENKFIITPEENNQIDNIVTKVMSTFPANIAEHIITDMRIELTGLYILTVCNEYLTSLSPGVAGEVFVNGETFAIIKIEDDILVSVI